MQTTTVFPLAQELTDALGVAPQDMKTDATSPDCVLKYRVSEFVEPSQNGFRRYQDRYTYTVSIPVPKARLESPNAQLVTIIKTWLGIRGDMSPGGLARNKAIIDDLRSANPDDLMVQALDTYWRSVQ